jgi:hypothetical protein
VWGGVKSGALPIESYKCTACLGEVGEMGDPPFLMVLWGGRDVGNCNAPTRLPARYYISTHIYLSKLIALKLAYSNFYYLQIEEFAALVVWGAGGWAKPCVFGEMSDAICSECKCRGAMGKCYNV